MTWQSYIKSMGPPLAPGVSVGRPRPIDAFVLKPKGKKLPASLVYTTVADAQGALSSCLFAASGGTMNPRGWSQGRSTSWDPPFIGFVTHPELFGGLDGLLHALVQTGPKKFAHYVNDRVALDAVQWYGPVDTLSDWPAGAAPLQSNASSFVVADGSGQIRIATVRWSPTGQPVATHAEPRHLHLALTSAANSLMMQCATWNKNSDEGAIRRGINAGERDQAHRRSLRQMHTVSHGRPSIGNEERIHAVAAPDPAHQADTGHEVRLPRQRRKQLVLRLLVRRAESKAPISFMALADVGAESATVERPLRPWPSSQRPARTTS